MRTIYLFLIAATQVFALDNAMRISTRTGGAQTARPFSHGQWFAKDEICNYPKPFVDGSAPAKWQADRVNRWAATSACPSGSVQWAHVSYRADVPSSGQVVIDFRNSTDPCSSGNQAACDAAGLTTAQALTYNSSGWDAQMQISADPTGTTTTTTVNARTMLTDNRCVAWIKGPAVTQYVCGPYTAGGTGWDTARTYAFGWKEKHHFRGVAGATIDGNGTTVTLNDVTGLTGLARPFKLNLDDEFPPERVNVCYVNAGTGAIYFGDSNGADASCANVNGRGEDGTTPQLHYNRSVYLPDATDIRLTAGINSSTTSIPVTDASSITAVTIVHVKGEEMRICNTSGNNLIVGTAAWPCAASASGRGWRGTGSRSGSHQTHSQVYIATATDRWIDAPVDKYKPLSPIFVLTFFDGWASVGIEYVMENVWTDRYQNQHYSVTFQKGTSPGSFSTVATKSNLMHGAGSSWRYPDGASAATWENERKIWTGTAPGSVRYDRNLRYMIHSGLLSHDPEMAITATGIANELSNDNVNANFTQRAWDHASNTRCALQGTGTWNTSQTHGGHWQLSLWSSAARGDVAPHPRWYLMPLYAMASGLTDAARLSEEVFWGNAACAGFPPQQHFEGVTGTLYCNAGTSTADTTKSCSTTAFQSIDAFGYPLSRDARPTLRVVGAEEGAYNPPGHWAYNAWQVQPGDISGHLGDFDFLPYVLSGDWYFYRTLQGRTAWVSFMATTNADYFSSYSTISDRIGTSKRDWAIVQHMNGHRGYAFGMRWLLRAAVISRDGTPEKEYWQKKVKTNIAVEEGRYNLTTGSYYQPCPDPVGTSYDHSYWCFGRHFKGSNDTSLSNVITYTQTLGHLGDPDDVMDDNYGFVYHAPWMFNYYFHALGDAERQGLTQVGPLRRLLHKKMVNQLLNRAEYPNPFLIQSYQEPLHPCPTPGTPCSGHTFTTPGGSPPLGFASFAALYQAVSAAQKAAATSFSSVALDGGYAQIARSAAAFLPMGGVNHGGFTGTQAFDHFNALIPPCNGNDLGWCLKPVLGLNIRARATGTTTATVLFDRPTGIASCGYAVSTTAPASTLDSGDTAVPATGAQQTISLTGLTTATAYSIRITCGASREYATFTTN